MTSMETRRGRRTAPAPAFRLQRAAQSPTSAVLLLHGGRADGLEPPTVWNLPDVRMRPFARSIARATAGDGVVLGKVRYGCRGWNGDRADAGRDALRALDELNDLSAGRAPTVLVGHSMGGRAALHAAGHPLVSAVVALAPWCPAGEPVDHLAGKRVVLLHGDRDRVTDPRETWAFAARARAAGAEVCALRMPGGDHAMLRRAVDWHRFTTRVVAGLLGLEPLPPKVAASLAPGAVTAAEDSVWEPAPEDG
ncbi:alpha/beta fold hydrolase [Streptomyces sp. NPDC051907]|uniref:alpha/beta hydrolase n=1 Tax=Streptomyces sp. NPDC051907 TaxID=3155284 RepID=UPI00341440F5